MIIIEPVQNSFARISEAIIFTLWASVIQLIATETTSCRRSPLEDRHWLYGKWSKYLYWMLTLQIWFPILVPRFDINTIATNSLQVRRSALSRGILCSCPGYIVRYVVCAEGVTYDLESWNIEFTENLQTRFKRKCIFHASSVKSLPLLLAVMIWDVRKYVLIHCPV